MPYAKFIKEPFVFKVFDKDYMFVYVSFEAAARAPFDVYLGNCEKEDAIELSSEIHKAIIDYQHTKDEFYLTVLDSILTNIYPELHIMAKELEVKENVVYLFEL